MLKRVQPEVGAWYENLEQDVLFEVVSLDDDSVGIQYFEGEIEEIELEPFLQMPLRGVEQPEDWSGPFEIDSEDRDESDFTPAPTESNYYFDGYDSGSMQILDEL